MRANLLCSTIVAATLLATVGCRNMPSSSGWTWNRKNNGSTSPAETGPQLPSAGVNPPSYGATSPPANNVAAGAMPAAYAPPAGGYQTTPYPEHPTGYANPAYGAGGSGESVHGAAAAVALRGGGGKTSRNAVHPPQSTIRFVGDSLDSSWNSCGR